MLTAEDVPALAESVSADPDRSRLLQALRDRAEPLIRRVPPVPEVKALLSRAGGVCPTDRSPLQFDPWNPDQHRCPRCHQSFSGQRHHAHWARAQHLWLAERMAELSLLAILDQSEEALARAVELYGIYETRYFDLPNRDNVLGPTHLFFSTYLESLWLTSYLAGAFMLRERGLLPEARVAGVDRVAEEAATIIADFNEGFSNRQTWHAAALTAIAAWFGDEELARTAVESRTGLLGHLADGFGSDGFWWEGENYHLFALRGVLQGLHWARAAGYDLLDDPEIRAHFRLALLAPTRSALPDFSYPARRDSRYGVSLAEPPSLELWEIGRAWLGGDSVLESWLSALYALPERSAPSMLYDAWLHDAGRSVAALARRDRLSWWALLAMGPPLPETAEPWQPESILLPEQGLAVLRTPIGYASLECGRDIGGHGHPDRLHLTLHAGGMHWLPDPGTGTYVEPVLEWYRSALAHNAPRAEGENAGGQDAWCDAFDADQYGGWCRATAGSFRRTVVSTRWLIDIVEWAAAEEKAVDLPWHFQGTVTLKTPGHWVPATFEHPFVDKAERFIPEAEGDLIARATAEATGGAIRILFHAPGAELLRLIAPGLPGGHTARPFLLFRIRAASFRWITVIDPAPVAHSAPAPSLSAAQSELEYRNGPVRSRYVLAPESLGLEDEDGARILRGVRKRAAAPGSPPVSPVSSDSHGVARRIGDPPPLDGTLSGFDTSAPLVLDGEHQYRRSEAPYDRDAFSAEAWVNWDGEALYIGVEVRKQDLCFRDAELAPLELDNEPDDIHSDGLQLFWRIGDSFAGAVVVPAPGGTLRIRGVGRPSGETPLEGRLARTDQGYLVTLSLAHPALHHLMPGDRIGFDLQVNQMEPDRIRRSGQLVWSGGGGWIYLRGDRQDPAGLGVLELG